MNTYAIVLADGHRASCPYWQAMRRAIEFLPPESLEAVRSQMDGK